MTARFLLLRCSLKVVPMLHNFSVLESENIEPNFWPEEIVFGVDEHKRPVLKDANEVHLGIRREAAKKLLYALQASRHVQIMLDVFIWVDVIRWFGIAGLKRCIGQCESHDQHESGTSKE
jgi:hypothetical protein